MRHEFAQNITNEWLTPPDILNKLGEFDLDPCASVTRPWSVAKKHYTKEDNGLMLKWEGRVFLNPPYGNNTKVWVKKLSEHGNGIAFVFSRTDTTTWHDFIWPEAFSILFLKGHVHFYDVTGKRAKHNSGAPSALVAYGESNHLSLAESGLIGKLIKLK